jgi:hypothetical protein
MPMKNEVHQSKHDRDEQNKDRVLKVRYCRQEGIKKRTRDQEYSFHEKSAF